MTLRLCAAVLLLLPTAAFAQGNQGPFGGLFGRTPERVGKDYRVFDLRTSSSGQYEDAIFDAAVPSDSRMESGSMASVNVGGLFEQRTTRLDVRLFSSGTYQQYLHAGAVGGTTIQSSASMLARVATRFAVEAAVNHVYTPFFEFHRVLPTLGPGGAWLLPSTPYVATALEHHSYEAVGGFTSYYAKHSSLSATVTRRETRFVQRPEDRLYVNGFRGLWSRQLSRSFRLKFGYSREQIHQSLPAGEFIHESIEAGVDFDRPLSLSRRTTLAITTETSIVRRPLTGRQPRLNGRVTLNSWLARTWHSSFYVARLTEFLPGFSEPLFSDNVGGSLTGLFSRRVELILNATGGRGRFGADASAFSNGRFTQANTTAQLNVALTRRLGVFVQHALNHFEMPPGVSSVAPLDRLTRQIYIVGITAWIPVIAQESDTRDTR